MKVDWWLFRPWIEPFVAPVYDSAHFDRFRSCQEHFVALVHGWEHVFWWRWFGGWVLFSFDSDLRNSYVSLKTSL